MKRKKKVYVSVTTEENAMDMAFGACIRSSFFFVRSLFFIFRPYDYCLYTQAIEESKEKQISELSNFTNKNR